MKRRSLLIAVLFLTSALTTHAHVGSPDIYVDCKAGPYQLFVTVNPPQVIPGVAQVSVRSEAASLQRLQAVPLPMGGPGAQFAPVPDLLKRSAEDPQLFTGSLWMMASGSWQIKLTADGVLGRAVVAVPVPSAALRTKKMDAGLGVVLSFLMSFLVFGAVAIVGASVREAKLPAREQPGAARILSGRIAMIAAFGIVLLILWLGNRWWGQEAFSYGQNVYKPLAMNATLQGDLLTLRLTDPGWLNQRAPRSLDAILPAVRTTDDLIPDHEHLMHLYAIRQPGLDVVFHLHPQRSASGTFALNLPDMPAGEYKLYADITHVSGFPETLVARLKLDNALSGRALAGDDAEGVAKPIDHSDEITKVFKLPDGYQMQWVNSQESIPARAAQLFRFRLVDPKGRAPENMQLYMGMLGHAAFLKVDNSVFAHVHPTGSVSMAAFSRAQEQAVKTDGSPSAMPMEMSEMSNPKKDVSGISSYTGGIPNEVSFPYGLPSAGHYRVFVQMKHGSTVETGSFDMVAR